MRRSVGLALWFAAAQFVAPGQTQDEQPLVRVSVNLIQLEAVVTDSKGNQITDLGAADFDVFVDKKRQKIDRCSYVGFAKPLGPAPVHHDGLTPPHATEITRTQVRRSIVFLVDDESFAPQNILAVRKAMSAIVQHQLQPGDLAAVVRTASGSGALEQFTADRNLLLASIERIHWTPGGRGGVGNLGPGDATPRYLRLRSLLHTANT